MSITTLTSNFLGILTDLSTSKEPVCAPWSLVPLLFVIFGLIIVNGFFFLGKFAAKSKKSLMWCNIFLLVNSALFLASEVYHEVSQYHIYGTYDWTSFPFQFCTMPLYIGLILQFVKKDKIRLPFVYFLATYCTISGLIPLILGQGQLCRWPTIFGVARSFIWHIQILGLAFFLIGFYNIGKNWKSERKLFLQGFCVFFAITVIAQLLNVGFHYKGGNQYLPPIDPDTGLNIKTASNAILSDPDSASCFYISPFFRSNMVVFSDIWLYCGWIVNYILYTIAFSLGAFGVLGTTFGLRKLGTLTYTKIKKNKSQTA